MTKSKCCGADIRLVIAGGGQTGRYYCSKCLKICDTIDQPEPTPQDIIFNQVQDNAKLSVMPPIQNEEKGEEVKDPKQMVVFKGTDIFYCNDEILEAIKKRLPQEKDNGTNGIIDGYSGFRLIKVSIEKMCELISMSKDYQEKPKVMSILESIKFIYGK